MVDDNKNSLDWTYVSGIESSYRYEFSIDNGANWNTVTTKPLVIGNLSIATGHAQVRLKEFGLQPHSDALISTAEFTKSNCEGQMYNGTCYAVKEATVTQDVAAQSCYLASESDIGDIADFAAEFSLHSNTSKLYWLSDQGTSIRYSSYSGWSTTTYDSNSKGYICKGDGPAAPTNPTHDDDADTFGWTYVSDYQDPADYEYSLDKGQTWVDAISNPIDTGDVWLGTGDIQVRVKQTNSRDAGLILKSTQAYTSTIPLSCTGGDFAKAIDGACYFRFDTGVTWDNAITECSNMGATLVSKDASVISQLPTALSLDSDKEYWFKEESNSSWAYYFRYWFSSWSSDDYSKSTPRHYICTK